MLAALPAAALAGWWQYFELEPWGEERADFRAGTVAATIANVNRGRNTKPYLPADFMPSLRQFDQDTIGEDEIERRINNFMRQYGG